MCDKWPGGMSRCGKVIRMRSIWGNSQSPATADRRLTRFAYGMHMRPRSVGSERTKSRHPTAAHSNVPWRARIGLPPFVPFEHSQCFCLQVTASVSERNENPAALAMTTRPNTTRVCFGIPSERVRHGGKPQSGLEITNDTLATASLPDLISADVLVLHDIIR